MAVMHCVISLNYLELVSYKQTIIWLDPTATLKPFFTKVMQTVAGWKCWSTSKGKSQEKEALCFDKASPYHCSNALCVCNELYVVVCVQVCDSGMCVPWAWGFEEQNSGADMEKDCMEYGVPVFFHLQHYSQFLSFSPSIKQSGSPVPAAFSLLLVLTNFPWLIYGVHTVVSDSWWERNTSPTSQVGHTVL